MRPWASPSRQCLARVPIAAVLAISTTLAAQAQDFAGKTVKFQVGFPAGGSTDIVGRLLARELVRYLPGSPSALVQNVPGANGFTNLNRFATTAGPDGLTVGVGSTSNLDPLYHRSVNATYDLTRLQFVGATQRSGMALVISKSALSRLHGGGAPVVMGSPSAIRSGMQMALWGAEYLDWKIRWVKGYADTAALKIALERGEIDMSSFADVQTVQELVGSGRYVILAQAGHQKDGRTGAGLLEAPLFSDLIDSKVTDPVARRALSYTQRMMQAGQFFLLQEGTPDAITNAFRIAFDQAMSNADVLSKLKDHFPDLDNMGAERMSEIARELWGTPEEAFDHMQTMARKQDVSLGR